MFFPISHIDDDYKSYTKELMLLNRVKAEED